MSKRGIANFSQIPIENIVLLEEAVVTSVPVLLLFGNTIQKTLFLYSRDIYNGPKWKSWFLELKSVGATLRFCYLNHAWNLDFYDPQYAFWYNKIREDF